MDTGPETCHVRLEYRSRIKRKDNKEKSHLQWKQMAFSLRQKDIQEKPAGEIIFPKGLCSMENPGKLTGNGPVIFSFQYA